jgi:hypothetical protein
MRTASHGSLTHRFVVNSKNQETSIRARKTDRRISDLARQLSVVLAPTLELQLLRFHRCGGHDHELVRDGLNSVNQSVD